MLEQIRPMDIERRSFEIITELLGDRKLDPENELVIKRAIHTTADFDYAEFLRVVRQQLDKLPQTQRRVIELSRFDNLAVRDIAQTLSLSEQTVKNNLSIGLKTLKKLLAQQSIVLLFLFYVNFV